MFLYLVTSNDASQRENTSKISPDKTPPENISELIQFYRERKEKTLGMSIREFAETLSQNISSEQELFKEFLNVWTNYVKRTNPERSKKYNNEIALSNLAVAVATADYGIENGIILKIRAGDIKNIKDLYNCQSDFGPVMWTLAKCLETSSTQEVKNILFKKKERPEDHYIDELQERIWDNIRLSDIFEKITSKSSHATKIEDYVGVEFYTEFQYNTSVKNHMMWIQINIKHKYGIQPVTPHIYRISKDEEVQKKISNQIWEGITEEDIIYIAERTADKYITGKRCMDQSQKTKMKSFYPAICSGNVAVESIPTHAQYKVFEVFKTPSKDTFDILTKKLF